MSVQGQEKSKAGHDGKSMPLVGQKRREAPGNGNSAKGINGVIGGNDERGVWKKTAGAGGDGRTTRKGAGRGRGMEDRLGSRHSSSADTEGAPVSSSAPKRMRLVTPAGSVASQVGCGALLG